MVTVAVEPWSNGEVMCVGPAAPIRPRRIFRSKARLAIISRREVGLGFMVRVLLYKRATLWRVQGGSASANLN